MQCICLQRIVNPHSGCGGSSSCRSDSPREVTFGDHFAAAPSTAPGFSFAFLNTANHCLMAFIPEASQAWVFVAVSIKNEGTNHD